MKTEHIVVKSTIEFKKRVKLMAEKDNKTLSSFVRDCILEHIDRAQKHGNENLYSLQKNS